MVYRFRVTYEEHEDVFRDIEIKASQTFHDFHSAIQHSINFDNSKPASFFTCDDYWRKEDEIKLEIKKDDKKPKRSEEPPKRKVIADYINDPHQKFIYVFDPEQEWTFQVELQKILPEAGADYPKCVKSSGNAPKQYKETNLPPPPPEEEDEEPKKKKDSKESLIEEMEAKAGENGEEEENVLPADEEDLPEGEEREEKNPEEDEEGESSDDFEFDDDDI